MIPTMTEAEIANQLDRLAAMSDDAIDLADIPEIPVENWASARRGLYRHVKQPVTLRLDADVVRWFKDRARAGGYQTEINRVLRHHAMDPSRRSIDR